MRSKVSSRFEESSAGRALTSATQSLGQKNTCQVPSGASDIAAYYTTHFNIDQSLHSILFRSLA